MSVLSGKYISVLGASTSTFNGVSNDEQMNATLAANVSYYPSSFLNNVSDTWWMQLVNAFDLKLCVNNSWSGSCITTTVEGEEKAGCMNRATELHNDHFACCNQCNQ